MKQGKELTVPAYQCTLFLSGIGALLTGCHVEQSWNWLYDVEIKSFARWV